MQQINNHSYCRSSSPDFHQQGFLKWCSYEDDYLIFSIIGCFRVYFCNFFPKIIIIILDLHHRLLFYNEFKVPKRSNCFWKIHIMHTPIYAVMLGLKFELLTFWTFFEEEILWQPRFIHLSGHSPIPKHVEVDRDEYCLPKNPKWKIDFIASFISQFLTLKPAKSPITKQFCNSNPSLIHLPQMELSFIQSVYTMYQLTYEPWTARVRNIQYRMCCVVVNCSSSSVVFDHQKWSPRLKWK